MFETIFTIAYELVDQRASNRLSSAERSPQDLEEELLELKKAQKIPGKEAVYKAMYEFVDVALQIAMEETGRLTNVMELSDIKKVALEARGLVLNWEKY